MPLTRTLFVLVATLATVLLIGNACTRRGGGGGPIPPTMSPPPTTYYVDSAKGNDKNSGTSPSSPFKTLTHAISVVSKLTTVGLTISMKAGQYSTRSGEVFPIAVPTGLVITGNGFGRGPAVGTFINGIGEDKPLEKALGTAAKTYYATFEVNPTVQSVSLDQVYVGVTGALPPSATYNSVDDLGQLSATHVYFAAGTFGLKSGGAVVPSGSLTCTACEMTGVLYALATFSLGSANPPSIVLEGPGKSIIGGGIGILTDGTANVTVSSQNFASKIFAYSDQLAPHASPSPSMSPSSMQPHATSSPTASPTSSPTTPPTGGVVDFGYGANSSLGGNSLVNSLVGANRSEFFITVPSAIITAFGNTWNANAQGANPHGFYSRGQAFQAGAKGRNVTIASAATGAIVRVGPPPVTPTPSPTPSAGPSGSPTASPT